MDPNTTLQEIRDISNHSYRTPDDFFRMCELFDLLDHWITCGGFMPDDWSLDKTNPNFAKSLKH